MLVYKIRLWKQCKVTKIMCKCNSLAVNNKGYLSSLKQWDTFNLNQNLVILY